MAQSRQTHVSSSILILILILILHQGDHHHHQIYQIEERLIAPCPIQKIQLIASDGESADLASDRDGVKDKIFMDPGQVLFIRVSEQCTTDSADAAVPYNPVFTALPHSPFSPLHTLLYYYY